MGAALQSLGDTQRIVEWDELPESVREIGDGFDPKSAGILMAHQAQWISIKAPLKVCPKGRRTGITFAEALDDTITAASSKEAGGDNVFYIGDTKEKGLEFIGYVARFARALVEAQGAVSEIEQFLFEDQDEHGNTREITAYRVRFASGFRVAALSSRPANIRGLQGKVVIDEAAFHPDVQGVLDAATALLIWGGEIRVISSHNGKRNPFNILIKDIEDGRYGADAVVYRATFDDAVRNGLYERVCLMKRWTPTADAKEKWYKRIRGLYGPRKAQMREELDAIPRDGGGASVPGVWIDTAMREHRPILRLALQDDFAARPESERRVIVDEWIDRYVRPAFRQFINPDAMHAAGMDFARHRDFSVLPLLEITATLGRRVPFGIEMHNVPTRQQEQILWAVLDMLPRFCGIGMDATGSGETLAEYTADKYGSGYVHQIKLSRQWYGLWMPKMIGLFEDGIIDLPRDLDWENDLRTIEDVDGIPMVPAVRKQDIKDPELFRHGDFAPALCLANFAALNRAAPIDFASTGRTREAVGMFEERGRRVTDTGFGTIGGGNDFRGF